MRFYLTFPALSLTGTVYYDNYEVLWQGETNSRWSGGDQTIEHSYYYVIEVSGAKAPITGYVIVKN